MAGAEESFGRPTHIEEATQAIAAMHDAHRAQATGIERTIDKVTAMVARPIFLISIATLLVLWIAVNSVIQIAGAKAIDSWPFSFLSLLVSCTALFIAVLILASQRRADRLANLCQQMTLETVLLITQKVSKTIDLMEELRRDSPDVKDRIDIEAIEMSDKQDHATVLDAIQGGSNNLPP